MSLTQEFDKLAQAHLDMTISTTDTVFQRTSDFLMPLTDDQLLEIVAHAFTHWPGGEVDWAMGLMGWVFRRNHYTDLPRFPLRAMISDYRSPFAIMRRRKVPRERYEEVEKDYLKIIKAQAERKIFYSPNDPELVEFKKTRIEPLREELSRYNLNYEMGEN